MPQMLLLPDPRPLVERLGVEFFRQAPQCPGVYLMRDKAETVLYVGKARNLRKRLASYRVANPARLPRRHLRMLRIVERIDLERCDDETAALVRESELLRSLRPRFNRAGTWPGTARFLGWRLTGTGLEIAVTEVADPAWHSYGPLGAGVFGLRLLLLRLLWCALWPERGVTGMPGGWFEGQVGPVVTIPRLGAASEVFENGAALLAGLFSGTVDAFSEWIRTRTLSQQHPFEVAVRENDLTALGDFEASIHRRAVQSKPAPALQRAPISSPE